MSNLSYFAFITLVLPSISAASDPRIINGFPAEQSVTQHQVSIRFMELHICGGSLINDQTVLTAAECLFNPNTTQKIPANMYRIFGGSNNASETVVLGSVKETIAHEKFGSDNVANNIGLMILSDLIPADHPTLKPIALVSSQPAEATTCQVTGWGRIAFENEELPTDLLAANVTIQSMDSCNSSWWGSLLPGVLCAGKNGQDPCQGDVGGPLVCDGLLAGVVLFGSCAKRDVPVVYSDVAFYREWIERYLAGGYSGVAVVLVSRWALFLVTLFAVMGCRVE